MFYIVDLILTVSLKNKSISKYIIFKLAVSVLLEHLRAVLPSCNGKKSVCVVCFFFTTWCALPSLFWHPRSCVSSQLYPGGHRSHLVTVRSGFFQAITKSLSGCVCGICHSQRGFWEMLRNIRNGKLSGLYQLGWQSCRHYYAINFPYIFPISSVFFTKITFNSISIAIITVVSFSANFSFFLYFGDSMVTAAHQHVSVGPSIKHCSLVYFFFSLI